MASEDMLNLLRKHIEDQRAARQREIDTTTKLAALNERLIFTNADYRSPELVKNFIKEMTDGLGLESGASGADGTGPSPTS